MRIVYKCNLNYTTVAPYLDSLIQSRLITAIDRKYKTTDEGKKFLVLIKKAYGL